MTRETLRGRVSVRNDRRGLRTPTQKSDCTAEAWEVRKGTS